MNNLNNHQLVLLTLLVSFVTSIATGIFTVTLLDQAPPAVTSTINRVVERTVETVVPTKQETIVKERVVVDKGGDLIVSAVQKTSPAVVTLHGIEEIKDNKITPNKQGAGFFITGQNLLLSFIPEPTKEIFILKDGKEHYLDVVGSDKNLGLTLFALQKDEAGNIPNIAIPKLSLLEADVQVGQTAIVLNSGTVAVSFVSGLVKDEKKEAYYRLYLDESDDLVGAPVINVEERVIGVLRANGELIPAGAIKKFIQTATQTSSEEEVTSGGTTGTTKIDA